MVNDGLWDAINDYHMGITAENVAEKYGLTREELDQFTVESQSKTSEAIYEGKFKDEIVPVVIKGREGDTVVDTDEGPRPGTTVEGLAKLKPAFKPDGIVTAGNSSEINDGVAVVVLVSEDKVQELGLRPQAEWIGGALALGHPVGASGCRILVFLIHELKNGQAGLATLCIGGGMGCSTVIRKELFIEIIYGYKI